MLDLNASITLANERPKRTYRGGVRTRQKVETGERILNAALSRFARTGFDGAAVRDIALDAGVTHAAIRLHFGTKEDLWKAAVSFLFERFGKEMTGLADVSDPLAEVLARYVRYCAAHPEHVRIMVHESIGDSERLNWMVDNHIAPAHQGLRPLLEAAMESGRLPEVPVVSLIYMMSCAAQAPFMLGAEAKRLYGIDVTHAAFVEQHLRAVLKAFGISDQSRKAPDQEPSRLVD